MAVFARVIAFANLDHLPTIADILPTFF